MSILKWVKMLISPTVDLPAASSVSPLPFYNHHASPVSVPWFVYKGISHKEKTKSPKYIPILLCIVPCLLFLRVAAQTPTILSFSPDRGPIGTSITITGNNFSPVAGDDIVYFGAVRANVTTASTTSLTVTVPVGITYQPITVTVNNLTAYTGKPFIVTFPSNIAGFTPNSFAPKWDYNMGSTPYNIAIGDVDGDGKPDLAVVGLNFNIVSILRNTSNTGILSFAAKVDFPTGSGPFRVATGDVNGDGRPDLVVVNSNANTISILRNTSTSGTISFAPKLDFLTGSNPNSVAIGDLDGDGKPDLAVTNPGSATVSVFRNTGSNGTISFATKVDYATGSSPYNVVTGDVDGDGKPDLALVSYSAAVVSIFRNLSSSGTISFAAKVDFATGTNPQSVSIGDLDDDGSPDLAVANFGSGTVSVFKNLSSTGTVLLAAKLDFTTGANSHSVAIGDLNGDGKPDLAATNSIGSSISVFSNSSGSGTISFAAKVDYTTENSPYNVSLGDIDGDGRPDLVVAGLSTNILSVIRNQTDGPNITALTPSNAGVGTTITIKGTNFTGATAVSLGGIAAAAFTVVADTVITAVVAAVAGGNAVVTTTRGTATLAGFYNGPIINAFSPASGPIGTTVVLTGSGFDAVAANNIVYFGAVRATVTAASATSLSVLVPVGTTYQPITVTTHDLTGYSTQSFVVGFPANTAGITASSFAAKVDVATGSRPINVAAGDVDGDGKVDLVVANYTSNTISIFRNTGISGTASFAAKVDYPTGTGPESVTIGDVDGDGKPDLAVANGSSNTISIFRNLGSNGTISLAPKLDYSTADWPYAIAISDLDGDGKPDLSVAHYRSSILSVFRNLSTNGTISFADRLNYTAGPGSNSIAAGDLDADGKPDLAVVNYQAFTVSVLKNGSSAGAISFGAKVDYATGSGPTSISIGDVDGDGKTDLVVANSAYNSFSVSNTVSIFRNTSSSTISFAAKVDYATGINPYGVAVGDLNGDGKVDLAVTSYSDSTVSVFKNTSSSGAVSFAAKVNYATGTNPYGLAIADLDGDSRPELAVSNFNSGTLSILLNQTDGPNIAAFTPTNAGVGTMITIRGTNFTGATAVSLGGIAAAAFTVVSDTVITAVVAAVAGGNVVVTTTKGTATLAGFYNGPIINAFSPASGPVGTTVVLTGTGFDPIIANNTVYFGAVRATVTAASAASLNVVVPVGTTYQPITVTTHHLTGFSTQPFVITFPSNSAGITTSSFAGKVDFVSGTTPVSVTIGDLDGDGKSDLVAANTTSNTVSIFRNVGAGGTVSFAAKEDYATRAGPESVAIGDVDGDGKPDLVVGSGYSGIVSVFRNIGDSGTIALAPRVDFTGGGQSVAISDLDGDGRPDLAVAAGAFLSVLRNTGASGTVSFEARIDYATATGGPPFGSPYQAYGVVTGDIDGDGKPDLAVTNSSGILSVFRNTSSSGMISFATSIAYPTGISPRGVAIGDVDGDGKPDLAVVNNGPNTVSIFRNTSSSGVVSFAAKVDYATGTSPLQVAIGDVDGDGKPDLAVANVNSDNISVFRNESSNGAVSFSAKVDFATGIGPYQVSMGDVDGDGKPDLVTANAFSSTISVLKSRTETILPLQWLYFKGQPVHNDVLLNWATISEHNTKNFVIERSFNGSQFTTIGELAANRNSTQTSNYFYTDVQAATLPVQILYYRLRQVDVGGRITYSAVITVPIQQNSTALTVKAYPNPFNQHITLQVLNVTATKDNDQVALYSLDGKKLYTCKLTLPGNSTMLLPNLPHLKAGVYLLKATIHEQLFTIEMIKQ